MDNKKMKTISKVTIVLCFVTAILDLINEDYALAVVFVMLAALDYYYVFKKADNKDSK